MAIDADIEEMLRHLTATEVVTKMEAAAEANEPTEAPYDPYGFPWHRMSEPNRVFQGTVVYQPHGDNWRWTLNRRREYGWKNRKTAWDHVEHGTASDEKAAEHDLRAAHKRHKKQVERTVSL